jgi:uncharacterized protein
MRDPGKWRPVDGASHPDHDSRITYFPISRITLMASLRFETGPRTGETLEINKNQVSFGRHLSCDHVLKHLTVSRDHFHIELTGGKYFLVDQKSGNGTFVNGQQISWVEVKDGDRIQAGPFVLVVELSDEERERAVQTAAIGDTTARDAEDRGESSAYDENHIRGYPREYLEGIRRLNAGEFFEAHEVWEEIWLRSSGETKLFYQTLIQAAVGMHHYERGNIRGALGMHKNVIEKLERLPAVYMSLDLGKFRREFEAFLAGILDQDSVPAKNTERPVIRLLKGEAEEPRHQL